MDVVRSNFEEACADLEEHLKSATFVVRPPSSPPARAAHLMPRCTRSLHLSHLLPLPPRACADHRCSRQAMDCEMTGIWTQQPELKQSLADTPEERYAKKRVVAMRYNLVQASRPRHCPRSFAPQPPPPTRRTAPAANTAATCRWASVFSATTVTVATTPARTTSSCSRRWAMTSP